MPPSFLASIARALPVLAACAALSACTHYVAERTPEHQAPVGPVDLPQSYPDISWVTSIDEARARAAEDNKPLLVFVRAAWSRPSVVMDSTIWQDARVLAEAPRFIALRIDLTDNYEKSIPETLKPFDVTTVPTTIIFTSDGRVTGRFASGAARAAEVAAALHEAK